MILYHAFGSDTADRSGALACIQCSALFNGSIQFSTLHTYDEQNKRINALQNKHILRSTRVDKRDVS